MTHNIIFNIYTLDSFPGRGGIEGIEGRGGGMEGQERGGMEGGVKNDGREDLCLTSSQATYTEKLVLL